MQTKCVIKRNGSMEELDITKIQKHTSSAVERLRMSLDEIVRSI